MRRNQFLCVSSAPAPLRKFLTDLWRLSASTVARAVKLERWIKASIRRLRLRKAACRNSRTPNRCSTPSHSIRQDSRTGCLCESLDGSNATSLRDVPMASFTKERFSSFVNANGGSQICSSVRKETVRHRPVFLADREQMPTIRRLP